MSIPITSISASNLKGATFKHALKPINFIVGPNFRGKTSIADAVRLALTGYLPELGKQPRATFGICSGRVLETSATLKGPSGELQLSRTWRLSGDSVKTEAILPTVDGILATTDVMLNAASWFDLSERERVEWVFQNSASAQSSGLGSASELCAKIRTEVLQDDEDFAAESVTGWFAQFEDHLKRIAGSQTGQLLDKGQEIAVEMQKAARAQAVTLEKTVAGLAGIRASEQAGENVHALESKLAGLRDALEKARERRSKAQAAVDATEKARSRKADLQAKLAGRGALEERNRMAQERLAALKASFDAVTCTADDVRRLNDDVNGLEADWTRAASAVKVLQDSINRNETEKAEVEGKTRCPYCGATGDGWKAIKVLEIETALSSLRGNLDAANEKAAGLQEKARTARTKYDSAVSQMDKKLGLMDQINKETDALSKIQSSLNALSPLQGELDSLSVNDDPMAKEELSLAGNLFDDARAAVQVQETALRNAMGRRNDLKRLAQAEKGRDEAKVEERIAKSAAEAFRRAKAKAVEAAFEPIVKQANLIFGSVLPSPIAYNGDSAEIGTWRDGRWIGHRTFSATEKLLAYSAIQAALANQSPIRVMILDEMLRAQGDVFERVIRACKEAVRGGFIDTFIGIIPGDPARYWSLVDSEDCQLITISESSNQ